MQIRCRTIRVEVIMYTIRCKQACEKFFNVTADKKPRAGQTKEIICEHCREYSSYSPEDFNGARFGHVQRGSGSKPPTP
jgi:hypothetical protein